MFLPDQRPEQRFRPGRDLIIRRSRSSRQSVLERSRLGYGGVGRPLHSHTLAYSVMVFPPARSPGPVVPSRGSRHRACALRIECDEARPDRCHGSPASSTPLPPGVLWALRSGALRPPSGRSTAQIILRRQLKHGHIIILESADPEGMAENLAVLDFEITPEQIAAIDALDQGESGRAGPAPGTCPGQQRWSAEIRVPRLPDRLRLRLSTNGVLRVPPAGGPIAAHRFRTLCRGILRAIVSLAPVSGTVSGTTSAARRASPCGRADGRDRPPPPRTQRPPA